MIGEAIELVLSERSTVKVAEMDGRELGLADIVLGDVVSPIFAGKKKKKPNAAAASLSVQRVYAICSIRTINGMDVSPFKNPQQYYDLAQKLGAREIGKLQEWAKPIYFGDDEPDDEDDEDEEGNG